MMASGGPVIPTTKSLLAGQPTRQSSVDEGGLLYEMYDDYFNIEGEVPTSDALRSPSQVPLLITPSYLQPYDQESSTLDPPENMPFFFVLSASSPVSPGDPETAHVPAPPLRTRDIPDTLSHLLPQSANSLLEVINVTEPTLSYDGREVLDRDTPGYAPSLAATTSAAEPSSLVIQQPRPRLRPQLPIQKSDPKTRITYPSASTRPLVSPAPVRAVRSVYDMNNRALEHGSQLPGDKHVRGRSSPFPLPIQFSFAPPSVPGSAKTSYSYF